MNETTNHTANENTSGNNFANSWMDHPAMKGMDPVKLELIRLAARQTAGKNGRSLAPIMMALITSANKKGRPFQRRTESDRPDGADGPHTHEEQYLIPSLAYFGIKKKGLFKALLLYASYGVLFSFLPLPILLFLLLSQVPVLVLLPAYHSYPVLPL